jgi:hypothetical protein
MRPRKATCNWFTCLMVNAFSSVSWRVSAAVLDRLRFVFPPRLRAWYRAQNCGPIVVASESLPHVPFANHYARWSFCVSCGDEFGFVAIYFVQSGLQKLGVDNISSRHPPSFSLNTPTITYVILSPSISRSYLRGGRREGMKKISLLVVLFLRCQALPN